MTKPFTKNKSIAQRIYPGGIPGPPNSQIVENCSNPAEGRNSEGQPPCVSILGVPVSLITLETAVRTIMLWTGRGQAEYVCVRDAHGVILAAQDPEMMRIHHGAGMVTPDGMPLVWLTRLRTKLKTGRVYGPDLMEAVCHAGQSNGLRHYFYGGKPGVAEVLIEKLKAKLLNISVAGFYSPPFRPLTEEEDRAVVDLINASGAHVVWVGLSTPKQEFWMRDHVGRIKGATLLGVGAAFDVHSGAVARAPKWMQRSGLQWLFRLASEPRRLWRRYFVVVPLFLIGVTREEIKLYLARKVSASKVSASRSSASRNTVAETSSNRKSD